MSDDTGRRAPRRNTFLEDGIEAYDLEGVPDYPVTRADLVALVRYWVTLTDQRRKLIDTHYKSMAASASALSDAEAAVLFASLTSAIRKFVKDPRMLGHIEAEFSRLVSKTPMSVEAVS